MKTITTDIAVIGAGGAGLRTAIAAAEANPELEVALISKGLPNAFAHGSGRRRFGGSNQGRR